MESLKMQNATVSFSRLVPTRVSKTVRRQLASAVIDLGKVLRVCTVYATFPLALCLGTTDVGVTQNVTSSGYLQNNHSSPVFLNNPQYGIDSSVTCPTPSFHVTSFGGWTDGSSNNAIRNGGSIDLNGNVNDYGVAVGLNIPFGGSLGTYCKDYAVKRLIQAEQEIKFNQYRYDSNLFNACISFKEREVDFSNPAFSEGGQFEMFGACRDVSSAIQGDLQNLKPVNVETEIKPNPLMKPPQDVRIVP